MVLDWFVDQARKIDPGSVRLIAPFLATLFLLILFSNLLAILPIPILQVPPTSYFSGPFGLALVAVIGVIVVSARINGAGAALKHFVWPNPLQLVAEVSHTLSLSLRLYGNIGGELIVASLAAQAVPYGIPLLVHTLGLIPAVVQPIVFTLLTVNYLATAARGGGVSERRRGGAKSPEVQARPVLGIARAR
jgi:F-type H+-transporting ATPase subunit a